MARQTELASAPHPGVRWRVFLRGLAMAMDTQAEPAGSAAILRSAGRQMARMLALPPVASMEALELEMNAVLDEIGWGRVRLTVSEAERCVVLLHSGLPAIGSAGEPAGTWLAAALEGLYEVWMAQQPGGDETFRARLHDVGEVVVLHYGRN